MCVEHVDLIDVIRFQTFGSSRLCCSLVIEISYRKISFVVMYACTVVDGCHIISHFICLFFVFYFLLDGPYDVILLGRHTLLYCYTTVRPILVQNVITDGTFL